jgi:hypothetical protein
LINWKSDFSFFPRADNGIYLADCEKDLIRL